MSIWSSTFSIGEGYIYDEPTDPGRVVTYVDGWSNKYPEETDAACEIDLAQIPAWCVPGHFDYEESRGATGDYAHIGPWLRLGVSRPHDDNAPMVVLDERAVESLRDRLTQWLDHEKVYPTGGVL